MMDPESSYICQSPELFLYATHSLKLSYQQINDDLKYWKLLQSIYWYDAYQKQFDCLERFLTLPVQKVDELEFQIRKKEHLADFWSAYKEAKKILGEQNQDGKDYDFIQEKWADFRWAFEQRLIPEYAQFLTTVDIIARDCYYPLLKVIELITHQRLKEPSGWLSPITVLKLNNRYEIKSIRISPVPLIVIPFDRMSNVWNLCAIHHEVAHDFFFKLTHLPQYIEMYNHICEDEAYIEKVKAKMDRIYPFKILEEIRDIVQKIRSDSTSTQIQQKLEAQLPPKWREQLSGPVLKNWSDMLVGQSFDEAKTKLQNSFEIILDQLLAILYTDQVKKEQPILTVAKMVHLLYIIERIDYGGWLNELYADMIGLMLAGPAYINSFQDILFQEDVHTIFLKKYPSNYFRILFLLIFAEEKLGYTAEVQVLKQRWYATFDEKEGLKKIRDWAAETMQTEEELLPRFAPIDITVEGIEGWLCYLVKSCWKAELARDSYGAKISLAKIYHAMEVMEYQELLGQQPKKDKRLTKREREKLRQKIKETFIKAENDLRCFRFPQLRPRYLVPVLRRVFEEKVFFDSPDSQWESKLRRIFLESVSERPEVTNAFRLGADAQPLRLKFDA